MFAHHYAIDRQSQLRRKLEREDRRNKTADERASDMVIRCDPSLLTMYPELQSECATLKIEIEPFVYPVANAIKWKRRVAEGDLLTRFDGPSCLCLDVCRAFRFVDEKYATIVVCIHSLELFFLTHQVPASLLAELVVSGQWMPFVSHVQSSFTDDQVDSRRLVFSEF